jgi:hypothetical protein
MGEIVREAVAENRLRVQRRRRIRAAAAAAAGSKKQRPLIQRKLSKEASDQVDVILKYMRAKFVAAHPGETRRQAQSNQQLRAIGMGHLADLNEALGLKES